MPFETVVKESRIQGKGLFAKERIKKGEVVAVKGGHIFDKKRLKEVSESLGPAEIQIDEEFFIGPLLEEEREGSMLYINHSCDPNVAING